MAYGPNFRVHSVLEVEVNVEASDQPMQVFSLSKWYHLKGPGYAEKASTLSFYARDCIGQN